MFDGLAPASSSDRTVPRFVWATQSTGGILKETAAPDLERWIEYRYPEPRSFGAAEVYWVEDEIFRCALPLSWSLQWWNGSAWKPVEGVDAYPTERDMYNRVQFSSVRTTAIRLRATTKNRQTAGIVEWRMNE